MYQAILLLLNIDKPKLKNMETNKIVPNLQVNDCHDDDGNDDDVEEDGDNSSVDSCVEKNTFDVDVELELELEAKSDNHDVTSLVNSMKINDLNKHKLSRYNILDLGTGSGCLLLSIVKALKDMFEDTDRSQVNEMVDLKF